MAFIRAFWATTRLPAPGKRIFTGMTEPFTISVDYKGRTLDLTARLVVFGYSHQFRVLLDNMEVYFEPDEEGLYRAVSVTGPGEKPAAIDRHLLLLIQQQLTALRQ